MSKREREFDQTSKRKPEWQWNDWKLHWDDLGVCICCRVNSILILFTSLYVYICNWNWSSCHRIYGHFVYIRNQINGFGLLYIYKYILMRAVKIVKAYSTIKKRLKHWYYFTTSNEIPCPNLYTYMICTSDICILSIYIYTAQEWFNESGAQQWDENEDWKKEWKGKANGEHGRTPDIHIFHTFICISWNRWQLHKLRDNDDTYWGHLTAAACMWADVFNLTQTETLVWTWFYWTKKKNFKPLQSYW